MRAPVPRCNVGCATAPSTDAPGATGAQRASKRLQWASKACVDRGAGTLQESSISNPFQIIASLPWIAIVPRPVAILRCEAKKADDGQPAAAACSPSLPSASAATSRTSSVIPCSRVDRGSLARHDRPEILAIQVAQLQICSRTCTLN